MHERRGVTPALLTLPPTGWSQAPTARPVERDDDALMVAARDGDARAVDTLVRRHRERVFGYAMKFFRDATVANDVTQEVCVDLLRALPRYSPRGSFRGFLYRVTINRCRMSARRRRCEDDARRALSTDEPSLSNPAELAREVEDALARLTPLQREAVLLRFWGGLSHEEIAALLAIPVGTAKSRLLAALEALRRTVTSW